MRGDCRERSVAGLKPGKPTRLTPQVQEQLRLYVTAGAPIPHACVAAGIPWPTCKDWLRKGRAGIAPYVDFVRALDQAKAAWTVGAVMRVTKAADKDWRASAWLLERRVKEFQPAQRLEHTGAEGKPIEVRSMSQADIEARARELLAGRSPKEK